ncbi:MAG: dTMP kinase [Atopobiaceae bacterium]|jgi:dTMP kinase|nr:dTMP kinase [Atopobiaceae bacterium]
MADSPATRSRPGVFVTLEGIDGCGKSTQVARLVSVLESSGREVVALREPGGTNISEKIRALLLDPANGEMSAQCELMLYEAARAQLVREVIEPALERGAVVVCDRFYDSTTAYQCVARGLDARLVGIANSLGSCGVAPDVTLLFDIDPEVAFARATAGGADRLEGEGLAFQRAVRAGYLGLASAEPSRVRLVDATGTPEEVFSRVVATLGTAGLPVFPEGA